MTRPGVLILGKGIDAISNPATGLASLSIPDGLGLQLQNEDGTIVGTSADTHGATRANILKTDTYGRVIVDGLNVGTANGATVGQVLASGRVSGLLPFPNYSAISPISATGAQPFSVTIDMDATITRWLQAFQVLTTNNGTNYWTVSIKRLDTWATLLSFNTSTYAVNTAARYASGAISVAVSTGMLALYMQADKTGTPGNLNLFGPAVYVQ